MPRPEHEDRIRVLVADDEPIICEAYEAFLTSPPDDAGGEGSSGAARTPAVDLVCCHQAQEVVEQVSRALASAEPFAIAFLDVNMPPGPNGIWAAEQIRALDPALEIVIVTAYSDISPVEISQRVPPAEKLLYLQKPFHPHEITQLALSLGAKWRAQRNLQASLARLARAQHLAGFGHWEYDAQTRRARWSEEMARLFGLPEDRDHGPLESLWERVHPDDRSRVQSSIERAARGDEAQGLEYRIRLPDGSERTIQHEVAAIAGTASDSPHLVGAALDVTERKKIEGQIRHLAYHDQLTGLRNRSFLTEYLPLVLTQASRRGRSAALLYIDLDYFKRVNDRFGHSVGDELLQEVAQRLKGCVRESDFVARTDSSDPSPLAADAIARMGGDEFIVLLTEVAAPEDPAFVAERIRAALGAPFQLGGKEVQIASSIGIAAYPTDGNDAETLVQKADAAMYHAKQKGRNGFEFFTESLNQTLLLRLSRESSLQRALDRQELVLHYQPKVDTRDGSVVGAEALVRWHDPERGLVPPAEFIPLAEETGLIVPLGSWVMREACSQLARWESEGFAPVPVSVNLSFRQFKDRQLISGLSEIMAATSIEPAWLEVEFTESTLMDDTDASHRILTELARLGLRAALDDFGTGYSSLSSLKRLPIDVLKLDRSFVRDVLTDKIDEAIVKAIIAMARELQIEVIAEGVESAEQLELLKSHGCHLVQGYLIGRPAPAADFAAQHLRMRKTDPPR